MGFLTHFFADDTELARKLAADKPLLLLSMQRYFESCQHKMEAKVKILQGTPVQQLIPIYKQTLADEFACLASLEKYEDFIIDDLASLEKRFYRFTNLQKTMDYALSHERYIYKVMESTHHTLQDEAKIILLLEKNPADSQLLHNFIGMLELEQQMVAGLGSPPELLTFYQVLAQGARIKHELTAKEHAAAEEIYEYMSRCEIVAHGEMRATDKHGIAKLTALCFNKLVAQVMDAVDNGIALQHTHVLFEYVNSDLFEEYVKKQIAQSGITALNNRDKIRIFIHIFRDLYNTRIEENMY
jgi:hypothetical protein